MMTIDMKHDIVTCMIYCGLHGDKIPATDACGVFPQFKSIKVPVPMVHLMSPTSKQHSPNKAPVWSDT